MDERLDMAVAHLAERQHGVVGYGQLRAIGLGRGAIEARVLAGRLHRIHVGVYAVGHRRLTVNGRRMAAVLACGPGAVASHQTAADLHNLRPSSSPVIHVTVPTHSGRRRPGIRIHRSRTLTPGDTTIVDDVPTTTVARTLTDLAGTLDDAGMRKAVERAVALETFDLGELDTTPLRLRRALATAGPPALRSDLESDFLALCREHHIPLPEVNVNVAGHEVDCLWRDHALVAEIDGWKHHRAHTRFVTDRRRDVDLVLAGLRVVRFTHDDLGPHAAQTAAKLRRLTA